MAGETIITVVGNLTAEPELRHTADGVALATFTVASNSRSFDRRTQEWKDGPTLYLRCSAWRRIAENIARSALRRGCGVIVQGRLEPHAYETKDGGRRSTVEVTVEDVGTSLKYAAVTFVSAPGSESFAVSGEAGAPDGPQAGRSL